MHLSDVLRATVVLVVLASACDVYPPISFNHPPEPGTVAFSPPNPTTTDAIMALLVAHPSDPDGDELTVTWAFACDGVSTVVDGHVIPAEQTAKGQTWVVEVVASDGEWTSRPFGASVLVRNTPPVVTHAWISPDAPTTSDDLVVWAEGEDLDGDEVSWQVTWTVDDQAAPEFNGDFTIPADQTAKSQVWSASVSPFDGEGTGVPAVVSVRVDNTLPTIGSVRVVPDDPTADETITAVVSGADDTDGDEVSITIVWALDGATVQTDVLTSGAIAAVLTAPHRKGQVVRVTATPSDGFADGATLLSDPVVIRNTPPFLEEASISPSAGTESTTFTCTPVGASDIDADILAFTYDWSVSGSSTGLDQDTLDGTWFKKGDEITCTITVRDDEEEGNTVTSGVATVENSPPTLSSATLSPSSATVETTLMAIPSGWSDADGDPASYRYLWYANGAPTSSTDSTFACSAVSRDDTVHVEITPWDGEDEGDPVESTAVTIENATPSISGVSISPSPARTDDTLTATPSGWSDADGDPAGYLWSWRVSGVDPGETDSTLAGEWFERGDHVVVSVTPYDGYDSGTPLGSSITIINSPPVADAVLVDDEPVESCTDVSLDGTGSADADEDPLTYAWSLTSVPSGSYADSSSLDDTSSPTPSFLVDFEGSWTLLLTVDDGSASDTTTLTFSSEWRPENEDPIADAGAYADESTWATCRPSGTGYTCNRCDAVIVELDAGGSTDSDGDPLHISWTVSTSPSGSYASLSDDEDVAPTLTIQNLPAYHGVTTSYLVSAQVLVVDCAGGYDVDTAIFSVDCTGL